MSETKITPKEIATEMGIDAKRVRAYMRANGIYVGQGNRHALSVEDARSVIEGLSRKGERTHAPQRSADEVHALLFADDVEDVDAEDVESVEDDA